MPKQTSIWVVEEGEYSDYHEGRSWHLIVGVFSTREYAERVCAICNQRGPQWYSATVVEWKLDPWIDELNQGLTQYCVAMQRDGTVIKCEESPLDTAWVEPQLHTILDQSTGEVRDTGRKALWFTVNAKSPEHAIKIVNERRIQLIAEGKWDA